MKNQTQSLFDDNYKPKQIKHAKQSLFDDNYKPKRQVEPMNALQVVIIGAIAAFVVSVGYLFAQKYVFLPYIERLPGGCGCLPPDWGRGEYETFAIETPCPEAVENQIAVNDQSNDEPVGWWSIEPDQESLL